MDYLWPFFLRLISNNRSTLQSKYFKKKNNKIGIKSRLETWLNNANVSNNIDDYINTHSNYNSAVVVVFY